MNIDAGILTGVTGAILATIRLRAYVEQLPEMFFAQKADLVANDHWRAMHWLEAIHGRSLTTESSD